MSQLRRNPLNGRWVTIAADRSERPAPFAARTPMPPLGRPCPFCPGNEEETPPALETYGPSGSWRVRVVPNLYPAFDGDAPFEVERVGPLFEQAPGSGIHEVLVLSPDHAAAWGDLDDRQAGLVIAAVRDRMEDHAHVPSVRYTQVIVNHGREAGASIEHPHGQLLGIPFVPAEIERELTAVGSHPSGCLVCEILRVEEAEGHRVVAANDRAVLVAPFWSGAPYEMLVIPRTHEAHLARARPASLVAVSHLIRDGLASLRRNVGDVAYNVVFHTAPHHAGDPYHWHVHVVPRLTTAAGFEQGTGVLINVVAPELAARTLRRGLGGGDPG